MDKIYCLIHKDNELIIDCNKNNNLNIKNLQCLKCLKLTIAYNNNYYFSFYIKIDEITNIINYLVYPINEVTTIMLYDNNLLFSFNNGNIKKEIKLCNIYNFHLNNLNKDYFSKYIDKCKLMNLLD